MQARDLIKLLLKEASDKVSKCYWLDPKGTLIPVPEGHLRSAARILNVEYHPDSAHVIYAEMEKLGYSRMVYTPGDAVRIDTPNRLQTRVATDFAVERGFSSEPSQQKTTLVFSYDQPF